MPDPPADRTQPDPPAPGGRGGHPTGPSADNAAPAVAHAEPVAATLPCFFDRGSLAAYLGISTRTLDRLDVTGRLPEARRIGARKRWPRPEIEVWLSRGCPPRPATPALGRRGRK